MLLSEKITLTTILLTIFFLIISGDSGLETFLILIFIEMLIIREMIEMFVPSNLKVRINIFIFGGLILFIWIVTTKILVAIPH